MWGNRKASKASLRAVENSNFLLQTDQANSSLTLYEKRVRESDLPYSSV